MRELETVTIHRVPVLGKRGARVTAEEVAGIVCDLSTEAHIIRHFMSLPQHYRTAILGHAFEQYDFRQGQYITRVLDDQTLQSLLATKGSKFSASAKNYGTPRDVFSRAMMQCQKALHREAHHWIDKGDRQVAYFLIREDYAIGTQNVISLKHCSASLKSRVRREKRGDGADAIEVNVLEMPAPLTHQMVVMLQYKSGSYRLETAYPGIIVTDLPQPAQHSPDALSFCQRAWQDLAFIHEPRHHA